MVFAHHDISLRCAVWSSRISQTIGSKAQAEFAARDRTGDAIPIGPRPAA
jgi:hypothetical protein